MVGHFAPLREKIRDLMTEHGYVCKEGEWDNWYSRAGA